ncbi:hypothetical protein LCGC14_2379610, partial [marine sediment metagenome]
VWYGPGADGEMKKSIDRIQRPGDPERRPDLLDISRGWQELMRTKQANIVAGKSLNTIGPGLAWAADTVETWTDFVGNLKKDEPGKITPGGIVSGMARFSGEMIRLTFKAVESGAKGIKVGIGTVSETVNAVTDGVPMHDTLTIQTPADEIFSQDLPTGLKGEVLGRGSLQDKYPILRDVASAMTGIAKLNPNVLFNRALQIPLAGKPLEEVKTIAEREFIASRIYFSGFADEAAQEDMIRRVQAGEDAQLIAKEYELPIAEAMGEFFLDPLNFLGSGSAQTASRFGNASEDFIKVAPDIRKISDEILAVGKTVDNGIATDLYILDDLAQMEASANRRIAIHVTGNDLGITAIVHEGKLYNLSRRSEIVIGGVVANAKSIEDANEAFYAIYLMASRNQDEVHMGMDIARKWKPSKPLLLRGEAQNDLGIFLQQAIDGDPHAFLGDLNKVVKKANAATAQWATDVEKAVDSADSLIGDTVIAERRAAKATSLADEIAKVTARGGKVDDLVRQVDELAALSADEARRVFTDAGEAAEEAAHLARIA